MTDGHQTKANSPRHKAGTHVLASRELVDNPKVGKFHKEVAKVEDTAKPAVFLLL